MQITLKEWLAQSGYSSADDALAEYSQLDSVYPALCTEGCEVEPDGYCPHGAPSGSGAKAANTEDDGSMQRHAPLEDLFKGRHFDQEIVVLCVRWYLSFKLSYRDLVAMMAERGIDLAHRRSCAG
jgi:hypothetical protein